jgi:hypothetical protein
LLGGQPPPFEGAAYDRPGTQPKLNHRGKLKFVVF